MGETSEIRRNGDFKTPVRHGDGRIDGLAEDDPHGFRGVFAELAHHPGGLAGLRGAGGRKQHCGGQERQVEFHMRFPLE